MFYAKVVRVRCMGCGREDGKYGPRTVVERCAGCSPADGSGKLTLTVEIQKGDK